MTAAESVTRTAERASSPIRWLPAAAVLLGTGWGAQQFTPLLLVYRRALGLGTGTVEAMFGLYALGLIPGLLLAGPLSDTRGRRAVVVPAAALSLASSLVLILARDSVPLLYAGRLLAGAASGAVFAAGTAWLRELSSPPLGTASDHAAARRAAVAMTTGFAFGPLVAGLLAQWAPAPRLTPYLPHLALMTAVLVLLRKGPETAPGPGTVTDTQRIRLASVPGVRTSRFGTVVAPMAPWVFAAPAIAFALLPAIAGAGRAGDGIALTATIAMLCALAGVLIQPLARRLDARGRGNRTATTGLVVLAAGLVLSAVTAAAQQPWLLVPCSIVLGIAYGLCLVAGLVEVQRLAPPGALARLTAVYYAVTYLGFAAPYLLALAAHLATYPVLLTITAALALGTGALVTRQSARVHTVPPAPGDTGALPAR